MTNSVKIELPPHDPIASTLSTADDRIVMSEWLPPQKGIAWHRYLATAMRLEATYGPRLRRLRQEIGQLERLKTLLTAV